MEYYSALKRKEILSHATAWMKPEDIMLSEISQSQKDYTILFIKSIYVKPFLHLASGKLPTSLTVSPLLNSHLPNL